MYGMTSLKP